MNETQRNPRHNRPARHISSTGSTRPTRPGRASTSHTRQQLSLLDQTHPWHLDSQTRSIGREGLAKARAALAAAPQHDWTCENDRERTHHAA
ncbi:MAG: hypothetical protein IH940_04785 [Acidobacteria bacterium]|nr:hypothetical protein [Acidobacteriota bacterium]